jgi:hypothetical protein
MKKIDFGGKPPPRTDQVSPDNWVAHRTMQPAEQMKRLTIDVPLSLHQTVKSQCAIRGENMADVIRRLLEVHFCSTEDSKEFTPIENSIV